MRHLILFSLACLSVAACGKDESQQDIQQVDQALANDNLVDNDLTAIDAITGSDAGMAADVDPSTWDREDGERAEGGNADSSPRRSSESPRSRPTPPAESQAPASNDPAPVVTDSNSSSD
jgi:hypothetical protein